MAVIDLKKTTVKIIDGTAITPLEITVVIGEGNLTYSIKRNIEYRLNRGLVASSNVREGDEEPLEVSLDVEYQFYKSEGAEPITPAEALQQIEGASAWVTTGADVCEPYAVDLEVEFDPNCGSVKKETLTFSEFRYESLDFDIDAGTLSTSGKCKEVRPTSVRS